MLKRLDPPTDVEDAHAPVALEPPEEFDPREALNFIWRRWKLVVGVTALALLIGALDLERQTPIYAASAELLLEPGKDRTATQQADHSTGEVLDATSIESQIEVIKSAALLRRVVEKEKL